MTQDEIIEMWDEVVKYAPSEVRITEFAKLVAAKAIAELESQEPDYWLGYGLQAYTEKPFENATALYSHPPQRTWQGLTPADMEELSAAWWEPNENEMALIDWVDAKLKEKNNA